MRKEPIGLYILRVIVLVGIFGMMLMLYWSSTLVENRTKNLQLDVNQLKEMISDLERNIGQVERKTNSENHKEDVGQRPHIDPSLPNLLEEDPFYKVTLPKELLPENFKPHGTLFHATAVGKPENLHPFGNWAEVRSWHNMCTVTFAQLLFGRYETLAPNMAIKMEERINKKSGATEFWFHLRDKVFWQPLQQNFFPPNLSLAPHFLKKHQVTAEDFKFYWDAIMNPYIDLPGVVALRNFYGDIEEIEIIDKLTLVIRWKAYPVKKPDGQEVQKVKYLARTWTAALAPLASFVYKYFPDGTKIVEDDQHPDTYRTNSVWAQNFSQHWAKNVIVSCGPWMFDGLTDRQIQFKRNPDHYQPLAVLVEGMEIPFRDTSDAYWNDFKSNKLDWYEIRADQLLEVNNFLESPTYAAQKAAGHGIRRLEYVARIYAYIGWNEARVFFKNAKVRQALTMAIDRKRIIRQNLNGLGLEITGTFYPYDAATDPNIKPWPYDPQQARRLLEEEGWYDSNGDGVIDKVIDGKSTPFEFTITYYAKDNIAKAVCEYVSTALKEIGINAHLNGVDVADLSAAFESKNIDAIRLAWSLGTPPEDPRQIWHSSGAKQKGSSNVIGFANPEADEIIDALDFENNYDKRIELYHRFDQILHEEAPYVFLYTPKIIFLYRERLQNVFLPKDRQDLIPGADVAEPDSSIFWLKK